jgi:hypothetical protein
MHYAAYLRGTSQSLGSRLAHGFLGEGERVTIKPDASQSALFFALAGTGFDSAKNFS